MRTAKRVAWVVIGGVTLVGGAGAVEVLRAAPPPSDGHTTELLKARAEAATNAEELAQARYQQGLGGYEDLLTWSRRVTEAKLELATTREERVALLRELVQRSARAEAMAADRQKLGTGSPLEVQAARFERLTAEIRLSRAESE